MKTLVIPDIHQRVNNVKSILEEEKDYDEVVFLGDWFDSFYEPPHVASFEETCKYLKYLVTEHPNKDKFIFLLGNHDVQYIYTNNKSSQISIETPTHYYCSGFSKNKAKTFRKVFFDNNFKDEFFKKNFKLAYRTQNWTISHAGVNECHIPFNKDIDYLVDVMAQEAWQDFRHTSHKHNWIMSSAGWARGGTCRVGGLLWQDWRHEFKVSQILGKQIVGHTEIPAPAVLGEGTDIESWNIDTKQDYGIIIDGKFITKNYKLKSGSSSV